MHKLFLASLIFGILIVSSCSVDNSDRKMIKTEIKKYLKKSIKNPRSYKDVNFEIFPITERNEIVKYIVKHEYKAKDGIGTLRNEIDCFIYAKDEEVLLKDPSCVAYKKLYKRLTE